MTEAILPSPPTSPNGISAGKRVSFGNDAVRTFVYEKDSEEATPIIQRQSFTDPDAPKSLVTVTTDTVRPESPSAIFPPTQLEEVRRVTISPPLPSKKMADNENPFRPEEILYHEVDPIVEQYMHKPFPPSRPGSAQTTPIKRVDSPKDNSPAYYQNGLSKEQLLQSEKAADNYENHNNHHNSDNNQKPLRSALKQHITARGGRIPGRLATGGEGGIGAREAEEVRLLHCSMTSSPPPMTTTIAHF